MPMNPIFFQMILGTYDQSSSLYKLRNNKDCLQLIFDRLNDCWKLFINTNSTGLLLFPSNKLRFPEPLKDEDGNPKSVYINMMPFVFDYEGYKELGPEVSRYKDMIQECLWSHATGYGEVCYLTIHESYVEPEESHRRGGLHTESPGKFRMGKGEHESIDHFMWGRGFIEGNKLSGGIYMASNISDSCRVWDAQIQEVDSQSAIGKLGNIEHLRGLLGPDYISVPANTLLWITDMTPHESVPLKERTFRQYFRLVTNEISGWFEEHSTPNPMGIKPNAPIIKGNKFEMVNLNESV
ncbi:hypothetical protein BC833DRAFT_620883 [Globomyces pollinis-pini]|nr:hypothetical protein BC833DRAFT_620883 [Globomyces pollinis-pini]